MKYHTRQAALRIIVAQSSEGRYMLNAAAARRFLRLCIYQNRNKEGCGKPFVRVHRTERGNPVFLEDDLTDSYLENRYLFEEVSLADAAYYLRSSVATVNAALANEILIKPDVCTYFLPQARLRNISALYLESFFTNYTADDLKGLAADLPLAHWLVMHRFASIDDFDALPRDDASALDKIGRTALHRAVTCSKLISVPGMVAGLLHAGCDPALRDSDGKTAGDLLIERTAQTPSVYLTVASNILFNQNNAVSLSEEADADLLLLHFEIDRVQDVVQNLKGKDMGSYLYHARSPAMVDALVSLGADVQEDIWTSRSPVSYAAACGRFDVEQRMIEHGADPMGFDADWWLDESPLQYAANCNDASTCLALLKRGANAERVRQAAGGSRNSDNEAWSLIMNWEQDVLEKVATDLCVAGGQEPRARARL